jgi:predicted nucleotidyltransferase
MEIIFESIVGSTAYGLAGPDSDVDQLGVYVEPTENLHGLKLWTEKDFTKVKERPEDQDRTFHEVGKFCRLALTANPTVTELLWVPESLILTNSVAFEGLRNNRLKFLSAERVKDAYMGYATAQFKKITTRWENDGDTQKRIKKHSRHLLRLMHQGFTLYSTGELPIRLDDPERYHEFGEIVSEIPSHALSTLETYGELFESTKPVIPEHADRDKIDRIVKWVRSGY